MTRKSGNPLLIGIVILLLAVAAGGIFLFIRGGIFDNAPSGQQGGSVDQGNSPKPDPITEQIKAMSLEEKVGQLVMAGVDGYEMDDHARQLIRDYQVGGFVLLKQNVKDSQQMLKLVNALKESNGKNGIPLFLALDEEGGRISRMPDDFIKLPASQKIGSLDSGALAGRIGKILGSEVKAFGMNVDFAPVLDIFSNPKNTVIGDRSFGSNPELVSKLGIQTMRGIQAEGVISVVKHFPGHGDTVVDSHIGLPTVSYDMERLKSFELVPFAEGIKNGTDGVMMAHILLPQIDPDYPASFSAKLITDLLRKDMNFGGVVFTDDLTMGAIVKNYDIGEVAVKSILAGSDIVLVCHDFEKEEAVLQALLNGVRTGKITAERLDESVYRILKLKTKYTLSDQQAGTVDVQRINDQIEELYKDYPALKQP